MIPRCWNKPPKSEFLTADSCKTSLESIQKFVGCKGRVVKEATIPGLIDWPSSWAELSKLRDYLTETRVLKGVGIRLKGMQLDTISIAGVEFEPIGKQQIILEENPKLRFAFLNFTLKHELIVRNNPRLEAIFIRKNSEPIQQQIDNIFFIEDTCFSEFEVYSGKQCSLLYMEHGQAKKAKRWLRKQSWFFWSIESIWYLFKKSICTHVMLGLVEPILGLLAEALHAWADELKKEAEEIRRKKNAKLTIRQLREAVRQLEQSRQDVADAL